MQVQLQVNGKAVTVDAAPHTLLVQALREQLKLTGTHVGCDTAQCGACTVHLNGRAVKSCSMLAVQAPEEAVTRFLADVGFRPDVLAHCSQVRTVKNLVGEGIGLSFLPALAAGPVGKSRLVYRRLHGISPFRELGIVRHPQRYFSSGAKRFTEVTKAHACALRESIIN